MFYKNIEATEICETFNNSLRIIGCDFEMIIILFVENFEIQYNDMFSTWP